MEIKTNKQNTYTKQAYKQNKQSKRNLFAKATDSACLDN